MAEAHTHEIGAETTRRRAGFVLMELGGVLGVASLYQSLQSGGLWIAALVAVAIAAWVRGWEMMMPEAGEDDR